MPTSDGVPDDGVRRLEAGAEAPRLARQFAEHWATERGVDPRTREDLRLMVSELVSNVAQHSDAPELWVRLEEHRDWWSMAVEWHADGIPAALADPDNWVIAPSDAAHGRGLGIVRSVVDEITVADGEQGVAVRCRWRRHQGV